MIGEEDSEFTYEYKDYYKILPSIRDFHKDKKRIKNGILVKKDFVYKSNLNKEWMTKHVLKKWISENKHKLKNL